MKLSKQTGNQSSSISSLLVLGLQSTATSSLVVDKEEDLCIIETISISKFPIYLVYQSKLKQYYAMKVYDAKDKAMNFCFANEVRFVGLRHPNVISMTKKAENKKISNKMETFDVSYILMELCHCDFLDLALMDGFLQDKKLVRTYFHQLVEGLEFLHSNRFSHLDLKLENLLLGKDLKLKIADFDLSYQADDVFVYGSGTPNFRAPEIRGKYCKNTYAADIYSLGIILFILMMGGLPYIEDVVDEVDLYKILLDSPRLFWVIREEFEPSSSQIDKNFKTLFLSMVAKDPSSRATLQDIKNSAWYRGPVYSDQELKQVMEELLESSVLN
jgi:Serine/threonine protein kinase